MSSEAISGNQRQELGVARIHPFPFVVPVHPEPIGNQTSLDAIRRHQRQSRGGRPLMREAIRRHQRQSDVIKCVPPIPIRRPRRPRAHWPRSRHRTQRAAGRQGRKTSRCPPLLQTVAEPYLPASPPASPPAQPPAPPPASLPASPSYHVRIRLPTTSEALAPLRSARGLKSAGGGARDTGCVMDAAAAAAVRARSSADTVMLPLLPPEALR